MEMFRELDKDLNKKIDREEWIAYWRQVKKSGYTEENINEVLVELEDRNGWIGFSKIKN